MATVTLGEMNGAVLSMVVDDGSERITSATLDCSKAIAPVAMKYPEDGSRVNIVARPGDIVTRTFTGAARLSKVMSEAIKPVSGETVLVWTAPTWFLGGV